MQTASHRIRPWSRLVDLASLVATPLQLSHYLEVVNPLWATHRLRARVEAVHDETSDARTLMLRPGRGWRRHRAGQFVPVGVVIDGRRHTRIFSISSSPDSGDGCIAITVKLIAGGRVSPFLVRGLRPGAYVELGLPQGDFVLPDAPKAMRPLFITAGSGITPVMSMLRSWHGREDIPDSVHLHHAPQAQEMIFGRELADLAAKQPRYRLFPIYTRELGGAKSNARHFTPSRLEELCPDWREREVWACGPSRMLDEISAYWATVGLSRHLHLERFHTPMAQIPAEAAGGTIRFAESGCEVEADGQTPLLLVAESAGLKPAHGCRMGICHSCDTMLISGCVRDLRTGAFVNESGIKVQLCVCAAAGDVELGL